MKVYILTDMEGVGGVVSDSQVLDGRPGYERAREWLTADANAAVEGALEGGASEVLVLDGHGANGACNLLYDRLHPAAAYVQGTPWAHYLQSLDSSFGALLQVGAHARAGTPGAVLEHTMSSLSWVRMRINGREMGEIGLCAAVAGEVGVPLAMVSGDDKACAEAAGLAAGVRCGVVKYGISRGCCRLLPPASVQDVIREAAREGVSCASEIAPLKIDAPVEIEIEYLRNDAVERTRERAGVAKTGSRSIVYTGDSVVEAFSRCLGG